MDWWTQTRDDVKTLGPVLLSFAIVAAAVGVEWILTRQLFQAERRIELGLLMGAILGPAIGPMIANWRRMGVTEGSGEEIETKDQELYLEGKMKRYSLLFSVNGGAFAIAKLLKEPEPPGGLSVTELSVGAIVFTVLMTADIWLWGAGMREQHGKKIFRPVGQTILLMIGALLASGWVLVSAAGDS